MTRDEKRRELAYALYLIGEAEQNLKQEIETIGSVVTFHEGRLAAEKLEKAAGIIRKAVVA